MILIRSVVFCFLLVLLAFIHGLQLLSLLLRPLSATFFRRLNARLAAFWWALLVKALEGMGCLSIRYFGQLPKASDLNVVLISNHQSLMDPLVILCFAYQMQSLSSLKWFVKDSLRSVPFLGWGLQFIDSIFLKRKWDEDRNLIAETFQKIRAHSDPIWLISFVEGTRLTPEKLVQSQRFAQDQGIEPFQQVLFPRYKGLTALLEGLSGRIDQIYDLTLRYECENPTVTDLLKGSIGTVDVYFDQTEVCALAKSSELQKEWLITQFRKKDRILESRS